MVVHHFTNDATEEENIEETCKVKNRKRKASGIGNSYEEADEGERKMLNFKVEEHKTEKCELSRLIVLLILSFKHFFVY